MSDQRQNSLPVRWPLRKSSFRRDSDTVAWAVLPMLHSSRSCAMNLTMRSTALLHWSKDGAPISGQPRIALIVPPACNNNNGTYVVIGKTMTEPDLELIHRAQQGDRAAVAEIVGLQQRYVYSV